MILRATPLVPQVSIPSAGKFALLACLSVARAHAGELTVTAAGEPVVITLDGKVLGPTPVQVGALPAGAYELGVRASALAATAFSQRIVVPQTGGVAVRIDWERQRAEVAAVAAPAGPARTSVPAATGELYVAAEAPGGAVWLDGSDTGRVVPVLLPAVPAGPHAVEVRTACARASAKATVAAGEIGRVELVLQDGEGRLQVASEPSGAAVLLDGMEVGRTPYDASVSCGGHELALRAPGHAEAALHIETPAYETTPLALSLQVETYGTLVLVPTPLEAAIEVDGVAVGTGPRTIEHVGSGEHQVRISADGYLPQARAITVAPDVATRVEVALQRPPAPHPRGGRIALDAAVTVGGLAAGGLAGWTYAEASRHFQDYLATPDDSSAADLYDAEVAPRRTAALIEGVASLGLLGTGAGLWLTTDLALTPAPGGLLLSGRW